MYPHSLFESSLSEANFHMEEVLNELSAGILCGDVAEDVNLNVALTHGVGYLTGVSADMLQQAVTANQFDIDYTAAEFEEGLLAVIHGLLLAVVVGRLDSSAALQAAGDDGGGPDPVSAQAEFNALSVLQLNNLFPGLFTGTLK